MVFAKKPCGETLSVKRIIVICLILFLSIFLCYQGIKRFGDSVYMAETFEVKLEKGERLSSLASRLYQARPSLDAFLFRIYVKFFQDFQRFQAGNYRFTGVTTPRMIAEKMSAGEVYRKMVLLISIPEGFTLKQIITRAVGLNIGSAADYHALMMNKAFIRSLGIKEGGLEGYFYPSTYRFFEKFPTPKEFITAGVIEFFKHLPPEYPQSVEQLGLSLYQAITFASLIERESQILDEKPKIAEVIWNRLRDKIPLAIDASVIYGASDYEGSLNIKHLSDKKNMYNTRIHRGLPPTPICSPSKSSLLSLLTPTQEGFYFYVLIPDDLEKRHHFSKSLSEHNRHVRRLVQYYKKISNKKERNARNGQADQ